MLQSRLSAYNFASNLLEHVQTIFPDMYPPLLIRAVRIVDPAGPWHQQVLDLHLEQGRLAQVGPSLPVPEGAVVWEHEGLHASPGWFDLSAGLNEPGFEHREDVAGLCAQAASGGFTDVATWPNTHPVVQHKEAVSFLLQQSAPFATRLHPMAAVTLQAEGQQLTEMVDLHHAGAVAFSDGPRTRYAASILKTALQYLQTFRGVLLTHPCEASMAKGGQMHEGVASTMLGMKGIPAIAEEMAVARDLALLRYAGGKLHFSLLSAAGSLRLVRQAKAEGLAVTCDVAAHQLAFTDEALFDFSTSKKVFPPFREASDVAALWEGLADGTIDAVVSAHQPHDTEGKELEFDLAEFGAVGLPTAFAALRTHAPAHLPLEVLVARLAYGPRKVLGLPIPHIQAESEACLTLFDPEARWEVRRQHLPAGAANSPFLGHTLTGKALGIVRGRHWVWGQEEGLC
jgi:dihydroorotase